MDLLSPAAKRRLVAQQEASVVREARERRIAALHERRARPSCEHSVEAKLDMVYGVPKPKPRRFEPTQTQQGRRRHRKNGTDKAMRKFSNAGGGGSATLAGALKEGFLRELGQEDAEALGFRRRPAAAAQEAENSPGESKAQEAENSPHAANKGGANNGGANGGGRHAADSGHDDAAAANGHRRSENGREDEEEDAVGDDEDEDGARSDSDDGYSDSEDGFEDDFEDESAPSTTRQEHAAAAPQPPPPAVTPTTDDTTSAAAAAAATTDDDWLAAAGADDDDDDDDATDAASQSFRSPIQRPSSATSNRSDGSPTSRELHAALSKVTDAINRSTTEDPVPPTIIARLLRAATHTDFTANGERGAQLAQRTCVALQCLIEDEGEGDATAAANTVAAAESILRAQGVSVLATILRGALERRQHAVATSCCDTCALVIETAARAQKVAVRDSGSGGGGGGGSGHSPPRAKRGVLGQGRAAATGARMMIMELSTLLVSETDSALKAIAAAGSSAGSGSVGEEGHEEDGAWSDVAGGMDADGLLAAQESACRLLRIVSEHGGPHGAAMVARMLDDANYDQRLDPWTHMSRDTVGALMRLLVLTPSTTSESFLRKRNASSDGNEDDDDEDSEAVGEAENSRRTVWRQLQRVRNEATVALLSLVVRCIDNAAYVKSYGVSRVLLEQRQQMLTSPALSSTLSGSNATGVALLASAINEFHMDDRVKYLAPHATAKVLSSTRKGGGGGDANGADGTTNSVSRGRPQSSPLMRAMAAQHTSGQSAHSRAYQQRRGPDQDQYTPGQWAAPSLETLAREFKEVVKTAHRIRINDASGADRKGKGLSDEAALAISRCEARRNYLLEQIREHELRRVQKARIRQRERVLARKAIEREKMVRDRDERAQHANDGRPGFAEKIKKRAPKKRARQRPSSSAALLRSHRPNTPSVLTRFQQRDMRHEEAREAYASQARDMAMRQEADMRARVEKSIRTRPHSSPPRGRRSDSRRGVRPNGVGGMLSPMQSNSTPALHAVFSPQAPYYAGGFEAQAREKKKWSARKEKARQLRREQKRQQQRRKAGKLARSPYDDLLDSGSDDSDGANRKSHAGLVKTRDDLRNKFGKDILGPSPSLAAFQRLERRPISAIRPRSPGKSRFPSQDANTVNFGSQRGHLSDPSSSWYTGHHASDTAKLKQNIGARVEQFQETNRLNRGEGRPSTGVRKRSTAVAVGKRGGKKKKKNRPATANARGGPKSRGRAAHTTVQGAKDLLRMVQAQRHTTTTMDPILQHGGAHLDPSSSAVELSDPSRPTLPGWSTAKHRKDIDSALVSLERHETGFVASESGAGNISDMMSPYRQFPTFVAEPDFSVKGLGRPALADPLYGPHEQLAKMRALGVAPGKRNKMKKKKKGKGTRSKKRPATGGGRLDPHRANAIGGGHSGVSKHRPSTSSGIRGSGGPKNREGLSRLDVISGGESSEGEDEQDEMIDVSALEPTRARGTGAGGITDNGSVVIPSTSSGVEGGDSKKGMNEMDALLADLDAAEEEEEDLLLAVKNRKKAKKKHKKVKGVLGGETPGDPPLIEMEAPEMVVNPASKEGGAMIKKGGKKKKKKKKMRRKKKKR